MSALPAPLSPCTTSLPIFSDLTNFLFTHSRLPKLGDPRTPWSFRGLLLNYVILISEAHPSIIDRWGYYLTILEQQSLPPDPIPQIHFSHPHSATLHTLNTWIDKLEYHEGGWKGFQLFVDWLAWMLGVSSTPSTLPDALQEYLYRKVNIGLLLEHPSDYLGTILSENRKSGWNPHAFFPTPHPVCEMMVRMTLPPQQANHDARTSSVCDPCAGTGRMLLHASNTSLNLYGMDIDPLVVTISKINGALYAPWLAFPLPAHILGKPPVPPPPETLQPVPAGAPHPLRVDDSTITTGTQLTFQWEAA